MFREYIFACDENFPNIYVTAASDGHMKVLPNILVVMRVSPLFVIEDAFPLLSEDPASLSYICIFGIYLLYICYICYICNIILYNICYRRRVPGSHYLSEYPATLSTCYTQPSTQYIA